MCTNLRFASLVALGGMAAANAQWSVVVLHPDNAAASQCFGGGGGQQVGTAGSEYWQNACKWDGSSSSRVSLHPIGASYSRAVVTDGTTQAGWLAFDGGTMRASIWHGTPVSWRDITPSNAVWGQVTGMSNGRQVGSAAIVSDHGYSAHAGVWSGTAESWVDLNPLGASISQGYAIKGHNQVGYFKSNNNNGNSHAALWHDTAASCIDLHPAGATSSVALGVSEDQQVGGLWFGSEWRGVLWNGTADSWIDLTPIGATWAQPNSVDSGFQVGVTLMGSQRHASLWQGSASSWLDLGSFLPPQFDNSEANSIWREGDTLYVAGTAWSADAVAGQAVMWVHEIPTPSSGTLLLLASVLGLRPRRRKHLGLSPRQTLNARTS
ncbi:MAG: hypothetical protein U0638_07585 [Phycisphaerales bacterium]